MAVAVILQLLLAVLIPVIAEIEMKFTKYPESVTAPVGDEVTFECAVRVPGELAWRWKPVDHPNDDWKLVSGTTDKENMSTKLVMEIQPDTPNSFYQCVVSYGAVSLASIPARLSVARLDVSKSVPRRRMVLVPVGNTVALHCKEPVSDPPAVLSWWKETAKSHRRPIDTPHGVLVLYNVTMEDHGNYGCSAINELSGQIVDLPEITFLRILPEGTRGTKFLEEEEYVGTIDNEGVLTMSVLPNTALRLWCGAVDSPPPRVTWIKEGENMPRSYDQELVISPFTKLDEGIYSCTANPLNPIRRSWKVTAMEAPRWEDPVANVNASEGGNAHIACGTPYGQPPPTITWYLNAEPLHSGKGIRAVGSDLYIERVEKRHASIVQCFACNPLGCAYDAALLSVVPKLISDQEYPVEAATLHFPPQPPKRHNRKNPRKHKPVLVPASKPNVTRLSDESVMVSWTHNNVNHGLPITFFKIQYREVTSNASIQWHTESTEIPSHIYAYEILNLIPDRAYKFRVAAVYSNQDNKSGKSSNKFYLHRGTPVKPPRAPVLTKAVALSTESIRLNWTWSHNGNANGSQALGFYIYYRALTTAGSYDKVVAPISVRSVVLLHLTPDTAYEMKLRAYSEQAPSTFSSILVAKTLKQSNMSSTTTESPSEDIKSDGRAPGALVTAGGALGAAALLVILVVTLLLCRRAKRPPANSAQGWVCSHHTQEVRLDAAPPACATAPAAS
ncbi:interference hedgehog-like [Hyposmocoma kahamanoa]|uniref:interference hedgehog-like n=1 Tax=Hyposmocoma kahamanoa TaxID=1477025 RepID=UPI000E6D74C3|nr:interference hedgehog-like [Hyposmocoma kahamanoa]